MPLSEAGREEEIRFDHEGIEADEIHERPQLAEDERDLPPLTELPPEDELAPMEAEAELPPEPELEVGRGGGNGNDGGEVPPPHEPEDRQPDPEPLPPLPPPGSAETPPPVWAQSGRSGSATDYQSSPECRAAAPPPARSCRCRLEC